MLSLATNSDLTVEYLVDECLDLGVEIEIKRIAADIAYFVGPNGESIAVNMVPNSTSLLEQILNGLKFNFDDLPLLVTGESKEIRLLTERISLAKLLPTVYSFTHNRYGEVPGTEVVRARFSSMIFQSMANFPGNHHLNTAFLGLVESKQGPLMAEQVVETSNLEIRVKRYHIGSPVHRYRFTDNHPTSHKGAPLKKWSRFETPVVCFDWRNPLKDENGDRLADEPISDDYAAIWIDDVSRAKKLASDTFIWLEKLFAEGGLSLVDICFFIDATGTVIFGEISPDCMRIRENVSVESSSFDKDLWRKGETSQHVLSQYQNLFTRVSESTNLKFNIGLN